MRIGMLRFDVKIVRSLLYNYVIFESPWVNKLTKLVLTTVLQEIF